MRVELLHATPLDIADKAIGKCWDKETDKPKERMYRVGNKFKHSSTLEHINYTFEIDEISRALLQEYARHRIASISVKSTRYTLKELLKANDLGVFVVSTGDDEIDEVIVRHLEDVKYLLSLGKPSDKVKYALPEAYKTSLVWTINMRSLQNFLSLRTDKAALWEIRELAREIFAKLPEEHKFMLEDFVKC